MQQKRSPPARMRAFRQGPPRLRLPTPGYLLLRPADLEITTFTFATRRKTSLTHQPRSRACSTYMARAFARQ
eukprot:2822491-Prymnesium_polylepis.1